MGILHFISNTSLTTNRIHLKHNCICPTHHPLHSTTTTILSAATKENQTVSILIYISDCIHIGVDIVNIMESDVELNCNVLKHHRFVGLSPLLSSLPSHLPS